MKSTGVPTGTWFWLPSASFVVMSWHAEAGAPMSSSALLSNFAVSCLSLRIVKTG